MSGEKFTNARVHEWLTAEIEAVTGAMHTTRIQLNSAALWWFCKHLTPKQRAEILGEYVKVQALGGTDNNAAGRGRQTGRKPVNGRKPAARAKPARSRQRKTGAR